MPPPSLLDYSTIDEIEAAMVAQGGPVPDIRVDHRFTPGLYVRTCHIPAGTLLTSMPHRTQHPFVVTQGHLELISTTEPAQEIRAPHIGITQPGTRRIIRTLTDTVWTTFHVTDKTDIEEIAAEILEPASNPLLSDPSVQNGWRNCPPSLPTL